MSTNHKRREFLKLGTSLAAGIALGGTGCAKKVQYSKEEMTLFEAMTLRQSIRNYKFTSVPAEHLKKILDAARLAPTAGNRQPWKFVIIQNKKNIEKLKEATIPLRMKARMQGQTLDNDALQIFRKEVEEALAGYFSAPVYIGVLTDSEAKYSEYNRHDGPIVAGYICLAARALGYGTVYLTDAIPPEAFRKAASVPKRYDITCVIPLGLPFDGWPERRDKKEYDEFIVNESF